MMKNKDVVIAAELAFYKVSLTKEMHYHSQLLLAGSVQVLVCFHILYLNVGGQNCKNLQTHSFLNAEGIHRQVDLLSVHLELEFTKTTMDCFSVTKQITRI